jgi:adenylyltransferase/sulfurtransferase
VLEGKPLVSGAILRFEGQVTTILPGDGHCYPFLKMHCFRRMTHSRKLKLP